jgi:hypothetical protein
MSAQTLTLAGKRYVLLPEAEYRRLSGNSSAPDPEDRRDAEILRRRLAGMRRRREKPLEYDRVRESLGLQ